MTDERFNCNMCGVVHTRDEIVLKANGDLLSALYAIPPLTDDNAEALSTVQGAVTHALDELELLGVEGFKHPDD